MTACIQSVTMFGSERWWKGDQARGTIGQVNELQLLVNQEARVTTGCLWTTNLGSGDLSMESGLGPAAAQLVNRLRRFGLRLLSLPQGNRQGRRIGPTTTRKRLESTRPSTRNYCRKRRPKLRRRRRNTGSD